MKKKYFWSIVVVLAITGYILYTDLKATPIKQLEVAAQGLNWTMLGLVVGLMISSYFCEAMILRILAQRKDEPKRSFWSYFRVPIIQTLFNAITPMSTGGQPAQLAALIQVGIEGGRATSLLLMKFIIYQIVVFAAYLSTIIFGFHLVVTKFATLSFFIVIGLTIHVVSTLFLLAIMFAYNSTKKATNKLLDFLVRFIKTDKIEHLRQNMITKIDTFYGESQKLKQEKSKLIKVILLTVLQLLFFYSIPYGILLALNIKASWLAVTQMNIMIIMFMAIIPLPGASGGAEYSFQTLFSTFILNSGGLVLGMFIWRFVTYFLGIMLGLVGWIIKPAKKQNTRKG